MIRRKLKNVIKNYTECEILVREATSNESWGPTNSILSKIAELSNDEAHMVQIMPLVWKRLKDKGRKWRHVYKSLILMHFLVTRGNASIAEYCRRNIHFIQSLESFTYMEGNVDIGGRIRKRAGELISLLKDSDLLKSERRKAMITDLRFSKDIVSQGSNVPTKYGNGVGSLSQGPSTGSFISSSDNKDAPKCDYPVPSTSAEEDIQLQIALAESKEEAERLTKTDEIKELTDKYKLDLAITENLKENRFESDFEPWHEEVVGTGSLNDPWSPEPEKRQMDIEPWSRNVASNESLWSSSTKPWPPCIPDVPTTVPADPWGLESGDHVADRSVEYCVLPDYNPWSQAGTPSSPVPCRDTTHDSVTKFLAEHGHLVDIGSLLPPDTTRLKHNANNPFLNDATHESHNPFIVDEASPWTVEPPCQPKQYNPFLT